MNKKALFSGGHDTVPFEKFSSIVWVTVLEMAANEAQEYALVLKGQPAPAVDSSEWISPSAGGTVEWTGLKPSTEYEVYARMKGSDWQDPSEASEATTVKTVVKYKTARKNFTIRIIVR